MSGWKEIHCNGKHEEQSRKDEMVGVVGLPSLCPCFVKTLLADQGTWGGMSEEEPKEGSRKAKVRGYLGKDVGVGMWRTKGTNGRGRGRFRWH